jgi:hypothetical protein
VPDAHHVAEQGGRRPVIGVVVRVHQVGDLIADAVGGGDLIHGAADIAADAGRRVE